MSTEGASGAFFDPRFDGEKIETTMSMNPAFKDWDTADAAELAAAAQWSGAVPPEESRETEIEQPKPDIIVRPEACMPLDDGPTPLFKLLHDRAAAKRVLRRDGEHRSPKHARIATNLKRWGLLPQPTAKAA